MTRTSSSSGPADDRTDELAGVEQLIARTADLLLKVTGLLDREAVRSDDGRSARVARLSWALQRAQRALLEAAGAPVEPVRRP